MAMTIQDLLQSDANISVTLSFADLQAALQEFAEAITSQMTESRAAEVSPQGAELLTVDQVCEYLGVTKPTLHRWNKLGYLTNIHVGRSVRYRRADVESFAVK